MIDCFLLLLLLNLIEFKIPLNWISNLRHQLELEIFELLRTDSKTIGCSMDFLTVQSQVEGSFKCYYKPSDVYMSFITVTSLSTWSSWKHTKLIVHQDLFRTGKDIGWWGQRFRCIILLSLNLACLSLYFLFFPNPCTFILSICSIIPFTLRVQPICRIRYFISFIKKKSCCRDST